MKKIILTILLVCKIAYLNAATQPNVVIFFADDFGWGDMRLHNTNPDHFRYTPHMDNLFTQGIELENYITHCVCSPSRAGLLTGKHFANVAAGPVTGGTLPNDIQNIAKDFKAAGYSTGAFGKWHNGMPNFPEDGNGAEVNWNQVKQYNPLHGEDTLDLNNNIFENHKGWTWGEGVNAYGFDRFVGFYAGGGDHFDHYVDWHHDADWWHDRKYAASEKGYRTHLLTQHATDFIDANQNDPFFCYIPHEAVHGPVQLTRTDLQTYCQEIETNLGITGQWNYVKNIVSPFSGNKIEDVEQLRFDGGKEFDMEVIDPNKDHFAHLIYAAYCWTLDQSIGEVIQKVTDIGELNNTIFVFASDNGATDRGSNLPFKGRKHGLEEGGTHVPAAIWWPGTFDKNTAPYSAGDNKYSGLITYIDIYPTLMAMSQQPLLGTNLDGKNCWQNLQDRTEARPNIEDGYFTMYKDYGVLRSKRWKLFYSESKNRVDLYDLEADIGESTDVQGSNAAVRDQMIQLYKDWIKNNDYAVSFITMDASNIDFPNPAPSGDVLEVRATQTGNINNGDSDGLFVRFSDGENWDEAHGFYVDTGDRVEFDIYVHPDSDVTRNCFYTPGAGWTPFYDNDNGLNQDGILLDDLNLPKGVWTRQVIGTGSICPFLLLVNFISFRDSSPGYYHYYLDNIVIRRADGGIRSVIWDSDDDFQSSFIYRYKNVNHKSLAEAQAVSGFPFSDVQLTTATWSGGSTDPVVSFDAPANNVNLNIGDDLYVNVNASDSDGIQRVRLYKDGVELARSEGSAPYEWNAPGQNDPELLNLQEGTYIFTARATDNVGSVGEASITVTVGDVPTNVVQNASFESGGVVSTDWILHSNASGSQDTAQDGSWSLKMVGPASPSRQTVTLEPNTDYNISVWVQNAGVTSGNIVFDTQDVFDAAGQGQFVIAPGAANTWTQYSGTFNSGTVTSITLRIFGTSMAGVAYFDNVVVEPVNVATNTAPQITSSAITTADEGVAYSYTVTATDSDGDTLTFTGVTVPSWLTFDAGSASLSGTPGSGDVGDHSVSISVSDGEDSDTQNYTITVTAAPDPYEEWKTANSITDDLADDDNDGIPNLMEFALGGDPNNVESGQRPDVSESGANFEFKFQRNEASLTYIIEKSSDLQTWSDHITVTDSHGVVGTEATVPVSVSEMNNGKLFLRLKVEQ